MGLRGSTLLSFSRTFQSTTVNSQQGGEGGDSIPLDIQMTGHGNRSTSTLATDLPQKLAALRRSLPIAAEDVQS